MARHSLPSNTKSGIRKVGNSCYGSGKNNKRLEINNSRSKACTVVPCSTLGEYLLRAYPELIYIAPWIASTELVSPQISYVELAAGCNPTLGSVP